jgi:hypothetical protein
VCERDLQSRQRKNPTAPVIWEFQVWVCRLPSHTPFESVSDLARSLGSLLEVPSLRHCYSLSCSDSKCWFYHRESDRLRRTRSYVLCKCSPGGCCLIRQRAPCFQRGRTLILEPPPVERSRTLGS